MEALRLMAVHAHPDDESSKGAATTARYVHEGAEVLVVTCTGGERGDVLNPKLKDDPHILRDIVQVRREEMASAAAHLGVQHTWLGFVDSGLPEGDPTPPLPEGCFALEPLEVPTEGLVRVVREFRPHVMTTYDEHGGYRHPDHVMTHRRTRAAVAALDPAPALYVVLVPADGTTTSIEQRRTAAAIAIVRIVIVPSPVCESLSRPSLRRPAEHRRR